MELRLVAAAENGVEKSLFVVEVFADDDLASGDGVGIEAGGEMSPP